ncbi:MAG: OsmC family protein [Flammeovirgaceae bacterium]
MSTKNHRYSTLMRWTGNLGAGTKDYKAYSRNYEISAPNKPILAGSSDPNFRGDATRYNPEEMLVAALSSCHMLWYLHLCAVNGVVVLEYVDEAAGNMVEHANGSGEFTEITLKPSVRIADASAKEKAIQLHDDAAQMCFIARSINFPVTHQPTILT